MFQRSQLQLPFSFFDPALTLVQNHAWTAWSSLDSESRDKTKDK